jgi:hypothetical protein
VKVDIGLAEKVTLTTNYPSSTSTCMVDVPVGGTFNLTG